MKLFIDLILISIIVGFAVLGYKRGLVKIALSFLKNIVAFLVAFAFSSKLGAWLKENFFMDKVKTFVENKVAEFLGIDSAAGADVSVLIDSEHTEFLKLLDKFGVDVNAFSQSLKNTNVTASDAIDEYIVSPCVAAVSNVAAFIALFVGTLVVLAIVSLILSAVTKLPVIKVTNRFFGGVVGLVLGLFLSLLAAAVIKTIIPYFSDSTVVTTFDKGVTLYNTLVKLVPSSINGLFS